MLIHGMPDDASLGLAVGGWLNDHEFFKHAGIGWSASPKEQYYHNNVHLSLWHSDDRDETGLTGGRGTMLAI